MLCEDILRTHLLNQCSAKVFLFSYCTGRSLKHVFFEQMLCETVREIFVCNVFGILVFGILVCSESLFIQHFGRVVGP
jgi:hypothetical protein